MFYVANPDSGPSPLEVERAHTLLRELEESEHQQARDSAYEYPPHAWVSDLSLQRRDSNTRTGAAVSDTPIGVLTSSAAVSENLSKDLTEVETEDLGEM